MTSCSKPIKPSTLKTFGFFSTFWLQPGSQILNFSLFIGHDFHFSVSKFCQEICSPVTCMFNVPRYLQASNYIICKELLLICCIISFIQLLDYFGCTSEIFVIFTVTTGGKIFQFLEIHIECTLLILLDMDIRTNQILGNLRNCFIHSRHGLPN